MWEEILKTVSVYFSAMLKFILGPIGGKAAGLSIITTMIVTAAAMMTVVILLTYFGEYIREKIFDRLFNSKKSKSPSRKWMLFIRKYGLAGIAGLTPLLLTPIGGTLLAVSFTKSREKIILFMFISACAWSFILTVAVYFGYDALVDMVKSFSDY
jgi:membrane protein DedA with SNARE-associated domain